MDKKRVAVSKKLRFEVFKRDSFTCQYCGRKAPEVPLHADHIAPVASGGKTTILNLITSCSDCNAGKGARKLSDNTVVTKKMDQLAILQSKKEQIDMLLAWESELSAIDDTLIDGLATNWSKATGYKLTAVGKKNMGKIVKKYGAKEVMDAMRSSLENYIHNERGEITTEEVEKAFAMISRICITNAKTKDKPWLKDLYFIRGIVRKRLSYCKDYECLAILENAHSWGVEIDEMRRAAIECHNWTNWKDRMAYLVEEKSNG